MNKDDKLCPSTTCHEGAVILGVVQGNETVALLNAGLIADQDFVKKVKEQGSPEKRFRFADTCRKCGCRQWTGSECGVIKEFSEANIHLNGNEHELPNCIIRPRCRWYSQEGANACQICPFVITDNIT
ncbi:MAG: hypothetical protein WAT19_02405 [Ferruginibacter sp.]